MLIATAAQPAPVLFKQLTTPSLTPPLERTTMNIEPARRNYILEMPIVRFSLLNIIFRLAA